MKNTRSILVTLLLTSSAFLAVLNSSCGKKNSTSPNKCQNVSCKNNGICNVGLCSCPNGFEYTDCSVVSMDRYAGTWTMHDSVIGSDHPAMKGTASSYNITIAGIPGSSIDFYLSGIAGNTGFQNLPCHMEDTLTRKFDPMEFRSTDLYGYITPSRLIIVSCIGVVNDGGNYIHGRYIKQYPIAVDSTVENDTLSYYALKP